MLKAHKRLDDQWELVLYFLFAYLFTWSIALPLAAATQGWITWRPPMAVHYLVAFGPLLAAFAVTALSEGRAGVVALARRIVRWDQRPAWLVVALSPLIAFGVLALGMWLLQGSRTDFGLLGQVKFLPNLGAAALLLWTFTFGLGEEVGWRGFALPRLQSRHSALVASLILWLLWALWHWPMFFYIYDVALLPLILLGMLCGTIFLTWLFNSTAGSLVAVILWHGSYNFITASAAGEGAIAAIITALVMVWAVVIVVWFKPANLARRPKVTSETFYQIEADPVEPATPAFKVGK